MSGGSRKHTKKRQFDKKTKKKYTINQKIIELRRQKKKTHKK